MIEQRDNRTAVVAGKRRALGKAAYFTNGKGAARGSIDDADRPACSGTSRSCSNGWYRKCGAAGKMQVVRADHCFRHQLRQLLCCFCKADALGNFKSHKRYIKFRNGVGFANQEARVFGPFEFIGTCIHDQDDPAPGRCAVHVQFNDVRIAPREQFHPLKPQIFKPPCLSKGFILQTGNIINHFASDRVQNCSRAGQGQLR